MPLALKVSSLRIHEIWISAGHDFKGRYGQSRLHYDIIPCEHIECHAGRGLVGDRFYDYNPDFKGQVTFFDFSVAVQLQREFKLPSIDCSAFRRNLLVSGFDLNHLIGETFAIDGVTFSGSEECAPCFWMDEAICSGAFEWLKGRGGLRARILTDGVIYRDPAAFC
ncbi:MAG: MOSC domain-containing protein [Opitutales bacterium]